MLIANHLMGLLNNSNLKWLSKGTFYLTRSGSHAYGTNLPTSDEDFKGVAVPPKSYRNGIIDHFEQAEFKHQVDGLDATVYDVRKFFKLAADCNPSILEVLFVDDGDILARGPAAGLMLKHRDLFISKRAKYSFSGYAVAQLKKLKLHRQYLLNPPKQPPTRVEFGLPERTVVPADQLAAAEAMIREQVQRWKLPIDGLDDETRMKVEDSFAQTLALVEATQKARYVAALTREHVGYSARVIEQQEPVGLERVAGATLGFSDNFLEALDKERRYSSKMREWKSYQNHVATRNAARYELERKFGMDTKHAMHLVRLIRMGEEILMGKGVLVKRPDAEELLSIRNGAWTPQYLFEYADKKLAELDELYVTSSAIPAKPNLKRLDEVCQEVVESME